MHCEPVYSFSKPLDSQTHTESMLFVPYFAFRYVSIITYISYIEPP